MIKGSGPSFHRTLQWGLKKSQIFVISCANTTLDSNKTVEIVILMCSNVCDDVTDFEGYEFINNTKI